MTEDRFSCDTSSSCSYSHQREVAFGLIALHHSVEDHFEWVVEQHCSCCCLPFCLAKFSTSSNFALLQILESGKLLLHLAGGELLFLSIPQRMVVLLKIL